MIIKQYGDQALLIEYEQKIELKIHEAVMDLSRAIANNEFHAITYTIPAYCSLTVGYDPELVSYEVLKAYILALSEETNRQKINQRGRRWNIPVCYEAVFAWDMEIVSEQTGLSAVEIIHWHTNISFHVFMLGFIPGFAYMGKLPNELHCKRKETPRKKVSRFFSRYSGLANGHLSCRSTRRLADHRSDTFETLRWPSGQSLFVSNRR